MLLEIFILVIQIVVKLVFSFLTWSVTNDEEMHYSSLYSSMW